MKVTLQMLLTRLPETLPASIEIILPDAVPSSILGIRMMPGHGIMNPEYLYLSTNRLDLEKEKGSVLVVLNQTVERPMAPKCPVLYTDADPADIYNALQEIYSDFTKWDREMHEALIAHAKLQDLLSISAPVVRHPVMIYDPSMRLMAFHDSGTDNDSLFQQTKEKGYMTSEGLLELEQAGVFADTEPNTVRSFHFGPMANIETLYSTLMNGDVALGYSVMLVEKGYDKDYEAALFSNLNEFIFSYLKELQRSIGKEGYSYEYFIQDLLNVRNLDPAYVQDRLYHVGLPFDSEFYLVLLDSRHSPEATRLFLERTMRSEYPDVIICEHQEYLLFLIYQDKRIRLNDYRRTLMHSYHQLFREAVRYRLKCCISVPFFKITDLRSVFLQLSSLAERGGREDGAGESILFMEEHMMEQLFSLAPSVDYLNTFIPPVLRQLVRQDEEKGTAVTELLQTYLVCGCRASDTAQSLHMTRNNVIYHIRRLENLYHFDLGDQDTRFRLQLGYYMMDYLAALN